MTPEQLKASILQMAIQGKLVEQRVEEGTAEELYQQIQEEKKKLIKERKIKKNKSALSIIESDLPFDLPITWKWVKWGDVVNIVSAKRVHQSDWQKEGIPFYRAREIAEMSRNDIVNNDLFISEELYKEFSKSGVPQPGDIMVTAVGTLGKTYIVKSDDKFYYKDASVICFENRFNMCSKYLSMMMNTPLMLQQIKSNSEGTTVATLTMVRMVEYLFPLPPLEEQHRIVAKIEELLPFIDRYAASYEKLEKFNAKFPKDMKKSILQYAIQGKLVEQRTEEGTAEELYQQIQEEKLKLIKEGKLKKTRQLNPILKDEIPYDFPETWKICYFDDIAFVTKLAGFEYTKYIANNLVLDGIPLFKGKNVQNGNLVLEFESCIPEKISDELSRSQINKKCLLTPYVGTIGNIAIFDGTFKAHLGSNVGKIEILNNEENTFVLEEYLLWFLRSTYGYAELTKYKKATAQESISIDAIRNVIVPIPPLEEQRRIVAKIEELLPYCDKLIK